MGLIFLDIDGVLNSQRTPFGPCSCETDPINVKALNRITDATGAWIIVSSIWRFRYPARSMMQALLSAKGVTGVIEGTTPKLTGDSTRGDEIKAWLDAHPGWKDVPFIIIDDDPDIAPFQDRFIQTSFETGLTEADADRAIAMLRR